VDEFNVADNSVIIKNEKENAGHASHACLEKESREPPRVSLRVEIATTAINTTPQHGTPALTCYLLAIKPFIIPPSATHLSRLNSIIFIRFIFPSLPLMRSLRVFMWFA
jgi:hypothetical protein